MSHSQPPRTQNWFKNGESFVTPVHDTYPFISDFNASSLTGKSVLITGASRGIGLTTAVHFAKAGCSKIALAARSSLAETEAAVKRAAAEAQADVKILSLKLDVTSISSVQAAAEEVRNAFGNLDILINNAGYLSEFQNIGESDHLEYLKTWEINYNGLYLCTRYFLPLVLESTLKVVVNLSSVGGVVVMPGASSYQTSKFAVCRFTEFLDAEYAEKGLVAFSIHPGGVKTELALNMPEFMHAILNDTPELAADSLVWLCKEKREWLAGRFVSVTWDLEELERRKDEIVEKDLLKFRMAF
ncbi:NAD(P)-binding protein [Lentithecium fluviatile CBS 122367]|uniref:NAD(P)-binding protein n=1 Tax=Lentithecium fluviatile CBS 122367 TaxID=1168545 RepID=A0A6G1J7C0_9PLEO|nr:NAD(P)-binding protein [Lentithecium fluviatile CBS 122367]